MWFRFWILPEHPFPVPCRLWGRDCQEKKFYIHSHASLFAHVFFFFFFLSFFFFFVSSTSRRRDDETYLQDRLKQWISFSHALIGCSNSGYSVQFTSKRCQTRVSYEQNSFLVCCRNKRSCSRKHTKKVKELEIIHLLLRLPRSQGREVWCTSLSKTKLISTYHLLSSTHLEKFPGVLEILQSVKSCLLHMALNSTS